jgi:hypothetical protein
MSLIFYAINFESIVLLSSVGLSLLAFFFPISVLVMKGLMRESYFDVK